MANEENYMRKTYNNLVGKTKKDIYIIKNKINDRVYIGQSNDTEKRFISHCKESSAKRGVSLIDRAIQKYGRENFYYEILESQITNYNEREKYWIKYYNSLKPNGYNITEGGEEPPVKRSALSFDDIRKVRDTLVLTRNALSDIARQNNISKRTVLRINQGKKYFVSGWDYPLRQEPNINGILTEKDVDNIIGILQCTYRQYTDIGNQYGVSLAAIKEINSGITHHRDDIEYPIRKIKNSGTLALNDKQLLEIIELLQTSNISINKIAKQYGVGTNVIYNINQGICKCYKKENIKYPLRKY